MAKPVPEYVGFILDNLHALGGVSARAMFGGYGVYRHGLMFGIIVDNTLYFKTDARTVAAYQHAGSWPFSYQQQGKTRQIAYYRCPDDVLEQTEELQQWAAQAYAVAVAVRAKK